MKPKSSYVWTYFIESGSDHVQCQLCYKLYSRKGRGTTALKNHLRSAHPLQYAEFLAQDEVKKVEKVPEELQVNLDPIQHAEKQIKEEIIPKENSWDTSHSHPKSKEFDKLITEMIALQNLPFNFVDGIGFRRLLHSIEPGYCPQDSQFYTTNMTNEIYPKVVTKIKDLLKTVDHLSFTTDIRAVPSAGVSFLSITSHGITKDFKRISLMLTCEILEDRHTDDDDDIAKKFNSMLRFWNISPRKVHCNVRDGGSSMKRAIRPSSYNDVDCAVHKLQLCTQIALESEMYVTQLFGKCRQIVRHFKYSAVALNRLEKIQKDLLNEAPLSIVQDCPTRWNSVLHTMERLQEIKDALSLYCNQSTDVQQITSQEWLDIEQCVRILKPFDEVTTTLSCSQTSVASVIPLIYVLRTSLQREETRTTNAIFMEVIKTLSTEINIRFGELFNGNLSTLATYLDPRFKSKFFNEICKDKVEDEILSLLNAKVRATEKSPDLKRPRLNDDVIAQPSTSACTVINLLSDVLNSSDEESVSVSNEALDRSVMYKSILNEYSRSKRIAIDEDPLQWWRSNTKFEILYSIVRKYLSPSPSSVPSEQLFSDAGLIGDELTIRLEGEKACKLLFLKYNLPLLDFDY